MPENSPCALLYIVQSCMYQKFAKTCINNVQIDFSDDHTVKLESLRQTPKFELKLINKVKRNETWFLCFFIDTFCGRM